MAPKPVPPAPPAAAKSALKYDELELPKVSRVGEAKPEDPTTLAVFTEMPVGKSYLFPVAVPNEITDEAERDAHFTAEQNKLYHRLGNAKRRIAGKDESIKSRSFSVRKVSDETYGYGVRVFRTADAEPAKAE